MEKGIVRKIDDLGRIVIPKEIRNSQSINSYDDIEIINCDDKIILKKNYKFKKVDSYLIGILNELNKIDNIYITLFVNNRDILNKIIMIDSLNSELKELKKIFCTSSIDKNLKNSILYPVVNNGEYLLTIYLESNLSNEWLNTFCNVIEVFLKHIIYK